VAPADSVFDAVLIIEEMARVCGVTGRIAVEANMGTQMLRTEIASHLLEWKLPQTRDGYISELQQSSLPSEA